MHDDYDEDYEEEYTDDGTEIDITNSPLASTEELASRVRRLVELRTAKEQAETAAKAAKKEFEEFQRDFLEEYKNSPLKGSINIEIDDETSVRITPRETKYGRILDYDKAKKYFEERNKVDEYMRDDFRMGRIHEIVREHIEQRKPLPEGLDFYTKEYFTITIK